MNYAQSIDWLEHLTLFPEVEKIIRIEHLIQDVLGDLEILQGKDIKFVHITGTNGKGSTAAMVASILKESGEKTGLFTSPHIRTYNERIQVNGNMISDSDFARITHMVKTSAERLSAEDQHLSPCLFEVLIVVALVYFKEQRASRAVLEVGVGGRKDPTNCIKSSTSIITNIDLDHTHILGKTKSEIAYDKAGIIKPNSYCITTEIDLGLIDIFAKEAKEKKAKLIVLEETDIIPISQSKKGQVLTACDIQNIELPLLGSHQLKNCSAAVMAAKVLRIDPLHIKGGIKHVSWPLRMEMLTLKNKQNILIDGAHTLDAFTHVLGTIKEVFKNNHTTYILGFADNKDWKPMCDLLIKHLSKEDCIIVSKASYKGLDSATISTYLSKITNVQIHTTSDAKHALSYISTEDNEDRLVCVIGSLYLASDIRNYITYQQ